MSPRPTRLLLLLILVLPASAAAQGAAAGATSTNDWAFGGRAGFSFSPDQFIIGGHLESPPLSQQFLSRLTFRPTFEIGIGDDNTRVMTHLEFALWAPLPRTPWSLYAVVGPGLEFADQTGGVVTFGVGAQHDKGYFGELKYLSGEARVVGGMILKLKR
jgi:hypothetical protein